VPRDCALVETAAHESRSDARPDDEEGVRQLSFSWGTRSEQTACYWSAVEGGIVKRGYLGPRSIDLAWSWWTPWSLR
jgi:hypothetical protein